MMADRESSSTADSPSSPVLTVTRYDLTTAFLIAAVIGLVSAVGWLSVVWMTNRPLDRTEPVPLELVELPGGIDDGMIEETLQLVTPEELNADPSLAEIPAEESEIQEVLDHVVELADVATEQAREQLETDAQNAGQPGSADGSGRRALGMEPGEAGVPRERRWYIRFADQSTIDEYARQLDAFGIELGALLPDGRLVYLSQLSDPTPVQRTVTSGTGEDRLYMTWQGGNRREADFQLFRRAGIEVGRGIIFHFYPPETEHRLAQLEQQIANRPVQQIRRTYFVVRRSGTDYEFVVTRQTYFR